MEMYQFGNQYISSAIESEINENPDFEDFCHRSLIEHVYKDWKGLEGNELVSYYSIPRQCCIGYDDKIVIVTSKDRSFTEIKFSYETK